jgi:hypothetical protein
MNQGSPKSLLGVTAAIELGAGLALLSVPAFSSELLLGATLETAVATTVARVGGGALFALGVVCSLTRNQGTVAKGLIVGMLLYNIATAMVLAISYWQAGLNGVLLWPGVILHLVMTAWCVMKLLGR